jgi:hypothetical protein
MFSKITLMIFMLLSTGALQAQDKPQELLFLEEGQKNAEVIFDMMSFVSMQSQVQGIKLNAEYRFTQKVLRRNAKQGWLAYDFDSKTKL